MKIAPPCPRLINLTSVSIIGSKRQEVACMQDTDNAEVTVTRYPAGELPDFCLSDH